MEGGDGKRSIQRQLPVFTTEDLIYWGCQEYQVEGETGVVKYDMLGSCTLEWS